MESTEDLLFLPHYHNHNHTVHNQNRTPSPSSSSSSQMDDCNDGNLDPFSLLGAAADLDMDLFPDAETMDAFEDLQKEEQRLREELMLQPIDINLDHILEAEQNSPSHMLAASPFEIEFHAESMPDARRASVFLINENSSSSNSSSGDMDLNRVVNQLQPNCQIADTFTLSPTPSMDSPPRTPPEMKVDVNVPVEAQPVLLGNNILTVNGMNLNLPKLLPALKNSKRGRSASHDDPPDVQALKRHIRMIRNRESASLSRKKKKEYMTGLESRVNHLEKENEGLKKENQYLRSKLQENGIDFKPVMPEKVTRKPKSQVGVVAKVALLGIVGFLMVGYHAPTRSSHSMHHSNLTEISRTLSNLQQLSVPHDDVAPLLEQYRRFLHGEEDFNSSSSKPKTGKPFLPRSSGTGSFLSNMSSSIENNNSTVTKPLSYLNGTFFNKTEYEIITQRGKVPEESSVKKERSRWRSRGLRNKKMNRSILHSDAWVFSGFSGIGNLSLAQEQQQQPRCPNNFNKTESLRIKSNLEDIFGRRRFGSKRKEEPVAPVYRDEPIVYSMLGPHDAGSIADGSTDLSRGLTLYEGKQKKFSTILDKLERREDTFYVVSLATDNQLLLSAKASNESSRPKMTLLLPWRNETLNEDTVLQIECEVFHVFNLNDKKAQRRRSQA